MVKNVKLHTDTIVIQGDSNYLHTARFHLHPKHLPPAEYEQSPATKVYFDKN